MQIDISNTIKYYNEGYKNHFCDCLYCDYFRNNVKKSYPNLYKYMKEEFHVDIEKPFEALLPYEEDGQTIYWSSMYIVYGECKEDFETKFEDFTISKADSYPGTDIDEPHFVIELTGNMIFDQILE